MTGDQGGLDARIYQSLPLPATHTNTGITVKQHEVRLITKDTVPPVPVVRFSVSLPNDCPWPFGLTVFSGCGQIPPTSTPPLMWPTSVSVGSRNFADAFMRHTQHSYHLPLRIALSRQSCNMHQICSSKLGGTMLSKNNRKSKMIWHGIHTVVNHKSADITQSDCNLNDDALSELTGIHHPVR